MTRLEELKSYAENIKCYYHEFTADDILWLIDQITEARRVALSEAADLCEIMAGEAISEGETDVAYHDTMLVARDQIRLLIEPCPDCQWVSE